MASTPSFPIATATLSSLISNPQAQLQQEIQERQKKLMAAASTAGQPAKLSDLIGPLGGMGVSPF
jgi:hypothetical protein